MEGDSSGYPSNIKEQGGGELDYSLGIDGVIHIPCLDQGFQVLGRKFVFPNESPVDAGDACSTVNEGFGFNGFHHVRGNDKLYWDLHSRRRLYKYICAR